MQRKFKLELNYYFHVFFLLWVAAGGVLLALYKRRELFLWINSRHNPLFDHLMYGATWMGQPEIIIPVLLSLMLFKSLRTKWYFIAALVCNIIPLLLQHLLKFLFHHPRPLKMYGDDKSMIHFASGWTELVGNNSFPSGHSQGAFSFFCFLSLLLPGKYRYFGLLFFFLALGVGYSRVYLAAHFFDDIYAGSILGTFATTLLFVIVNNYRPR